MQFGIDPTVKNATADPDGDGVTNADEYLAGTHPRGFFSRYFAEGATSSFFDTRVALLNTSATTAGITLVRFLTTSGTTVSRLLTIPALTAQTLDAKTIPGLESTAFSVVIEADTQVVAERTLTWDATAYGSHGSEGAAAPASTWYVAEGATHSGFKLFYLLGNPNPTDAQVLVRFLRPAPLAPVEKSYVVAAGRRLDVWVNVADATLAAADVSAVVTSSVPIVVERSMYRDVGAQVFGAGHSSVAAATTATAWYLAEGATGPVFDTYLLLLNPTSTNAQVRVTYLLPSGAPVVANYLVQANSRFNVWVDGNPSLPADTALSIVVESTNGVAIVAERAMWWPGAAAAWLDGHSSLGATAAGVKWAMAGPREPTGAHTYVLLENTSIFAGSARLTVVLEGGGTLTRTVSLPARSRQTVPVDEATFAGVGSKAFGIIVESLGTTPAQIVVERSTYYTSAGVTWAAGSNAGATRLQ